MNCCTGSKLTNDCIFNVSNNELRHTPKTLSMTSKLKWKAVHALEKASAPAVACEGKIERVDLCLCPVGFTSGGPLQKAGCGCSIRRYFLVQDPVLVPES